jgi:hypothetical protein
MAGICMRSWLALVVWMMACTSGYLQAAEPEKQALFWVERSKNANIIQYDAQVGPDGKLYRDEPVVGYWVRLAKEGQVEEMSWLQWIFAFGFDIKMSADGDSAEMIMRGGKDRPITVRREGDRLCAVLMMEGAPACIEKAYINAKRKGLRFKVYYLDFWGFDTVTGEHRYERIVPD